MWFSKLFRRKNKTFLESDPTTWSYCPIGLGINIPDDSMIPCPRCKSLVPAISNGHWIKDQLVCRSCADAYKNLCKVVDNLPKIDTMP